MAATHRPLFTHRPGNLLACLAPIAVLALVACSPRVTAPPPVSPTPSATAAPEVAPCDACEQVFYRPGSKVVAISKTDGQWHEGVVIGSSSRSVVVIFRSPAPGATKPEAVPRRNVRKRAP